jgi:hypothetical protein
MVAMVAVISAGCGGTHSSGGTGTAASAGTTGTASSNRHRQDTNRIPSSNRPGGMTILNAAAHTCGALLRAAMEGQ